MNDVLNDLQMDPTLLSQTISNNNGDIGKTANTF